jgi:hypothetical protein
MSPLPTSKATPAYNDSISQGDPLLLTHHLSKRFNWNPLHYATLPIRNNWSTFGPILEKYNTYTRPIAVILGAFAVLITLDQNKWKLPRWPWAKDGLNNPKPSEIHPNEKLTVDELAEQKLMEMLKEMKLHEGLENAPWENDESTSLGDESTNEAEEQFLEDAGAGVGDVVEEMEGEAAF